MIKLSLPADLRDLASTRLSEAKALLDQSQWSGAYYLAGYAVECALKACITREFGKYRVPDLQIVKNSYTHNLVQLINVAKLGTQFQLSIATDEKFELNWAVVKDWNESSRYSIWTEVQARDLYKAITQRGHGVLRWTKQYW